MRSTRADAIGPCGGDHRYLGELARSRCITVPNAFDRCTATKIRAAGRSRGRDAPLHSGGATAPPIPNASLGARRSS
jgi:hypothetical protein